MPASAVIPALRAYLKIVAVKKPVVENWLALKFVRNLFLTV